VLVVEVVVAERSIDVLDAVSAADDGGMLVVVLAPDVPEEAESTGIVDVALSARVRFIFKPAENGANSRMFATTRTETTFFVLTDTALECKIIFHIRSKSVYV
jgi:hypothetical protein